MSSQAHLKSLPLVQDKRKLPIPINSPFLILPIRAWEQGKQTST